MSATVNILCRLGRHSWPRYVTAHTQAPAPIRCQRGCGKRYGSAS